MKYRFQIQEVVVWAPLPGWEVEGVVIKQSSIFWLSPAYLVHIEPDKLDHWTSFSTYWKVPEAALRKQKNSS